MIGEIDVDTGGPKRLERSASTLQKVKKAKNEEMLGAVLACGTIGMLVTISSSECPGIKNLKEFLYVAGAISMINGVWPALFKIKQTEAAGDKVAGGKVAGGKVAGSKAAGSGGEPGRRSGSDKAASAPVSILGKLTGMLTGKLTGCQDSWATRFPKEIDDHKGRSCSWKSKWGQCDQFAQHCERTCGRCGVTSSSTRRERNHALAERTRPDGG